jgi:surfactin synthase thioesterase subunit
MCPAFSPRFFRQITAQVRRLPLRFVDVEYPPRDYRFRLAHARQAIVATFQDLVQQGTPADRIGILGYSLGGYLGVQAAAGLPEKPGAFILLAAPASWARRREEPSFGRMVAIYGTYGLDTAALVDETKTFAASEEADAVAARLQVPTLILHGRDDQNVLFDHAVRFRNAIGAKAVLKELAGDHFLRGHERAIANHLRRFLQHANRSP